MAACGLSLYYDIRVTSPAWTLKVIEAEITTGSAMGLRCHDLAQSHVAVLTESVNGMIKAAC
jgi:hypothetical protein